MSKTLSHNLRIDELITQVTQTLAGSACTDEPRAFAHCLRRFLSVHGAYCGGYLLFNLGMARRMWDRPLISFSEGKIIPDTDICREDDVSVVIDVYDNGMMDMMVEIPMPDNLPQYPGYFFDHRFASEERTISLRFTASQIPAGDERPES